MTIYSIKFVLYATVNIMPRICQVILLHLDEYMLTVISTMTDLAAICIGVIGLVYEIRNSPATKRGADHLASKEKGRRSK